MPGPGGPASEQTASVSRPCTVIHSSCPGPAALGAVQAGAFPRRLAAEGHAGRGAVVEDHSQERHRAPCKGDPRVMQMCNWDVWAAGHWHARETRRGRAVGDVAVPSEPSPRRGASGPGSAPRGQRQPLQPCRSWHGPAPGKVNGDPRTRAAGGQQPPWHGEGQTVAQEQAPSPVLKERGAHICTHVCACGQARQGRGVRAGESGASPAFPSLHTKHGHGKQVLLHLAVTPGSGGARGHKALVGGRAGGAPASCIQHSCARPQSQAPHSRGAGGVATAEMGPS